MPSTDRLTRRDERPPLPRATGAAAWLPLVAVSLGFFMVILDVTVVTVAVPAMGAGLRAGPAALQWVVDGYTLVFACLLPLCGALGDRFGHRGAFLWGLAVFTLASAACGAAPVVAALVVARLAQGAGAASMVPASLALLRASYPLAADRARAFGVWGAVSGLGAAAGPLVGGLAVWGVGWRTVFLVNLPFGLLAMLLTRARVPAPAPRPELAIPLRAQLAGVVALAAVTAGLNEGGSLGWGDPLVLGCFGLSVAGGLCVAALSRGRARSGMARARRPALAGGCLVGVLLNLGFYGLLFLATLYFQRQRDYGPLRAGAALLPMFVVMAASSFASGRISARVGARAPMVAGLVVGAVGLAGWLAAGPGTPYGVLIAPMALAGLGTSFAMPAATITVMESAPPDRGGAAAALLNAGRQLGSALGVALFGSLSAQRLLPGLHVSAVLAAAGFAAAAAVAWVTGPRRG